ncbi:MAG: MerR family transcriptional regulator [Wenzhouxiangellaceae bacterium]|nr:MerR family transcriptional regulator [Wenzhouxiangellaceae bacterium]
MTTDSTKADSMTIGTLARHAGVGVETVRYYQRRGLVREPPRPYGTIRRYDNNDLRRLRFIRATQELGFTLAEIEDLLRLDDGVECEQAQRIAGEKRADIHARIERLQTIDRVLGELLEQCHTASTPRCPMIRALGDPESPIPAELKNP